MIYKRIVCCFWCMDVMVSGRIWRFDVNHFTGTATLWSITQLLLELQFYDFACEHVIELSGYGKCNACAWRAAGAA